MFNIIVPELNVNPKITKDAIINILTIEWPLSLKTIFNRIKKEYNYNYSYQAVFKAVKELVSSSVLNEKEKKYEINIEWIKKLQSFTDIVETNYYAKERLNSLSGVNESKQKADLIVLNFETLFDAEKYLYYFMKSELLKTKNDTICMHLDLEWRPIFYLRSEYNYYRRLKTRGHKFYFLSSGKTYLESLCQKFYSSQGINYKKTNGFTNDTLAFKDYFISIYIPEQLKSKMKKMLERKSILELLKLLEEKTTIRVVINKDTSLSHEFKNKTLSIFKSRI